MPGQRPRIRSLDVALAAAVIFVGLHSTGRFGGVIAISSENLTKHPANRDSLVALVTFYRDVGNIASAPDYAKRLAQVAPDNQRISVLVDALKRQLDTAPR